MSNGRCLRCGLEIDNHPDGNFHFCANGRSAPAPWPSMILATPMQSELIGWLLDGYSSECTVVLVGGTHITGSLSISKTRYLRMVSPDVAPGYAPPEAPAATSSTSRTWSW